VVQSIEQDLCELPCFSASLFVWDDPPRTVSPPTTTLMYATTFAFVRTRRFFSVTDAYNF
ncbi:MAG: hypothetical protein ACR2IB_01890, partial [Pyrinomonadaceae bacterium]